MNDPAAPPALTADTPFDASLVPEDGRAAFGAVKTVGDLVKFGLEAHGRASATPQLGLDTAFDPNMFGADSAKVMAAKKITTLQGLHDWAMNGEKLHGQADKFMPKPEPGKLTEFFKANKAAFGGLEKPEDYAWNKPELPEGISFDETAEKSFRQFAFDRSLPREMAQDMFDFGVKMMTGQAQIQMQKTMEERKQLQASLAKEWGGDAPKHVEMAQYAARQLGIDAALADQLNSEMSAPAMLKLFAQLGAKMEGAATITGDGKTLASTADQARADLSRREANPDMTKAFNDKNHPGHASELAEREKLNRLIYGGA
jgi:hypothetical protein